MPVVKWSSLLRVWGWPETRVLTIGTSLPAKLLPNAAAATHWTAACNALEGAQRDRRGGNYDAAGMALRDVAQNALFTWCAVWGESNPGATKNASAAITFMSGAIPDCRPEQGKRPGKDASPDAKRLCAIYSQLWQLYGLSQEAHHPVGAKAVYTSEDIDTLLTSLIALLRSLPALWEQYPTREWVRPSAAP